MTDMMIGLALAMTVIFVFLLLAFLGHLTASGLESLTRKRREVRANVDEGKNDMDDSREGRGSEQSGP